MKQVKYSKSRIERSCGICGVRRDEKGSYGVTTIKVGDLYRMISHYGRLAGAAWPICEKCDTVN